MKEKFGMYNPLYSKKYQYSVPLKKMDLCAKANGKHNCSSDFLPLQGAGAGFWMSNTDNNNNLLISESPTDNMGKGSEILGANSFGRVGSEIKNGYRLDDNMQVIPRDIENKIDLVSPTRHLQINRKKTTNGRNRKEYKKIYTHLKKRINKINKI